MASRKDELRKAKEAGESIVAKQFGAPSTSQSSSSSSPSSSSGTDARSDMFTMTYDEAREKYGKGPGASKYFMSKSDWEKGKARWEAEQASKQSEETPATPSTSLVASQFADKPKAKTWADVKSENGNDPAKIAEYLNNNPDYVPGNLTKAGMAEMGYKQGEDGKWTMDQVLDELDNISAEVPEVGKQIEEITNPETGEVDETKARKAVSEYEAQLVNLGAGTFDENGNFILKPTNKAKGWETWATMISVGLSVIGLAMGIPVYPINFRAITGKDTRDAQIQALQQQYMNIKADSASTIDKMNADVEAGNIAKNNKEALRAQEEHTQNMGAYKTKADIDTDSDLKKIDKQSEAEYKRLMAQLNSNEKIAQLQLRHAKEMAVLQSDLSTKSAEELTRYSKAGWVIDYINECKSKGMTNKEIALAVAGINGVTPTQMGLKNAEQIVGMVNQTVNSAAGVVDAVMPNSVSLVGAGGS